MSVLTGLMGAGKTWFLKRLFNLTPPTHYTSTGVTEQSCRGLFHHTGTVSSNSLDLVSHSDVLEILAYRFRQQLPPSDGVPPGCVVPQSQPTTSHSTTPTVPPTSTSHTTSTFIPPAATSPHDPPSTGTATSTLSSSAANYVTTTTTTYTSPSTLASSSTNTAILSPPLPQHDISPPSTTTTHSIMTLVKTLPQGFQNPTMLELVHMIDTGGQPEFMESMPSLVHNCHLAVLVLNLVYGLDDYPSIDYHEEGKRYKRALPSQYSTRQIIQKLASTLQAKRFSHQEGQCFKLLVVATHRDRLWWWQKNSRIREFDQAVSDILLPACEKELIRFTSSQILFDLNLKKPGPEDLEKLALIREKVGESGVGEVVQTPGSFLIFEQELVEFSETKVCRSILSLDECLEVGAKLKMNSEMVRAALIFFHRQITFLYFRDVLPNLVFTKPQVPLDCINARVTAQWGKCEGVAEEVDYVARFVEVGNEAFGEELVAEDLLCDDSISQGSGELL